MIWAGGDDGRGALACVLREAARPEQRERLLWWVAFHMRAGFRWLLLYVDGDAGDLAKALKWLGATVCCLPAPEADAGAAGARPWPLACASAAGEAS